MSKQRGVVLCALLLGLSAAVAGVSAQTRTVSSKVGAKVALPRVVKVTDVSEARHMDGLEPRLTVAPTISLGKIAKVANAPEIELGLEPVEGNAFVYDPLVGTTSDEKGSAQVSLLLAIKNKESAKIKLEKVVVSYTGGSKEFTPGLEIASGSTGSWQNSRDYHQVGEVLYLSAPLPSSLTVKLHFKGFTLPISVTKPLKPYATSFQMPFKVSDLRDSEVWEGGSTHGGGTQVFAYDLGVHGYNGAWSSVLPNKDGSQNSDYRVWGKPVYAMADGVIVEAVNEVPNNPKPVHTDAEMQSQKDNQWGAYTNGGGGNHFYIQHGELIALYAHMQKGSLNSKLLSKGNKVKKGDFLGYAGNSGNSTNPHLHIHVRKETTLESGPFRPLIFSEGYAIYKKDYPEPGSTLKWSKLAGNAIPGYAGDRSYIWPSGTHPNCAYPTDWGQVAKHGISESDYQKEFDKIWTCGYRPSWIDGFAVNGKVYFNAVFQKEDAQWVARHNLSSPQYQAEFDKWGQAGYTLVNVDSYLKGDSVRYTAIWSKAKVPSIRAYHGADDATHQANFDKWVKEGWVPVNMSVVAPNGERQTTALYSKTSVGGFYALSALSLADYKAKFKEYGDDGFKLVYINGYNQGGSPKLSAIWYKTTPFGSYIAKHYLTAADYQAEFTTQTGAGFSTRAVTGYEGGNVARYEGLWVK
jgi:Bacterial tandem repeat domain 1/Peptidase family M23